MGGDLMLARVLIRAPAAAVSDVLLNAPGLPAWNPAFLSVSAPSAGAGAEHAIRVRGGLAGTFLYTRVDPQRVESAWQVRGLSETNYWALRSEGQTTWVEHGLQHRGVLAAMLRGAFAEVAELRVSRLKLQVESRWTPPASIRDR